MKYTLYFAVASHFQGLDSILEFWWQSKFLMHMRIRLIVTKERISLTFSDSRLMLLSFNNCFSLFQYRCCLSILNRISGLGPSSDIMDHKYLKRFTVWSLVPFTLTASSYLSGLSFLVRFYRSWYFCRLTRPLSSFLLQFQQCYLRATLHSVLAFTLWSAKAPAMLSRFL